MTRNKRHLRTMPDGNLVISIMNCEDDAPDEIFLCRKTRFEIGREYLVEPSGVDAYSTITELGADWRSLVHFVDWVRWNEPLPLDECHSVDASELPLDRSSRARWALVGLTIVINPEESEA